MIVRNLLVIGICCLVFGVILFVVGFQERGLAAQASREPEEIALKDLIVRGPDGNPNIILKDFALCPNFVYKSKGGSWTGAWVPVVPSEGLPPGQPVANPGQVQALVFTINARDQGSLLQLCGQPKLRALVTNKIVSLGSQEKALLSQNYPGTDFSRCLIIQEGREPAGPAKLLLMMGGGTLLTLAGLGFLGFNFYRWRAEQAPAPPKRRVRGERDEEEEEDEEEEDRPRKPAKRRKPPREPEEE